MEQPSKRYPEFVISDDLMPLHVEQLDRGFMIGRKYDMIHYFPQLEHWVLKVYDDELGMCTMHIDESTAGYVADEAGIEIHEREKMTVSEYEGYMQAQANQLEDWLDD